MHPLPIDSRKTLFPSEHTSGADDTSGVVSFHRRNQGRLELDKNRRIPGIASGLMN